MKRYGNLYHKIYAMDNLELAYHDARKGKTWQKQIQRVDAHKEENLERLQKMLMNHAFHTAEYRTKEIYEPKHRTIYILPFYPDRIVQHAIINVMAPIWDSLFIYDSYACRKGKGQHKGSIRCMQFVRQYEYCIQGDISKFYPSIRHDILKEVIRHKIKDQEVLDLLDDIIDSTHTEINVPIGNFLSQWFGNLVLNELDMFVKHELHCRAYVRYCDDFVIFGNDKTALNKVMCQVKQFVYERLDMKLSKLSLFHTWQGLDFLGYRHFPNGKILVRKSTAKRIRRRMRTIERRLEDGTIDKGRAMAQIASAYGWLKHAKTHNLAIRMELDELKEMVNIDGKHT